MSKLITNKNEFTISYDEIMRIKTGSGITQLMKLIYCRVLRFTENGRECFMSNQALADEFGTTPRSVTDATNALVGLNALIKNHRFNDSNIYIPLLWTEDNKFSPEYLAEIERKKKAKKSKKAGGEETSTLINTPENEVNQSCLEETSSLDMKKLLGGDEETSSLDMKKLPSNKQSNIQLNKQTNKQEETIVEIVSNVTSHTEELKEDSNLSLSLPLSEISSPPIVTTPSLADSSFNFDKFRIWLTSNSKKLAGMNYTPQQLRELFLTE